MDGQSLSFTKKGNGKRRYNQYSSRKTKSTQGIETRWILK